MYKQIETNKIKTVILIALFIAIIGFFGYLYSSYTKAGYYPVVVALGFASISAFFSYYYSDKIALAISGAKPITHEQNKELFHLVENLCIASGLPMPKIYIIPDPSPNAFATGRNPRNSALAVTSGLLEIMEKRELEGVISHELSHIKNYDILVMTIVVVLVGAVSLVSDWFLRSFWFSSNDREGRGSNNVLFLAIGLVLAFLAPLVATLLKLAVSRKREFLADANGALLTRFPEGLASALEKIKNYNRPLRRANHATAHLFIASPFRKVGGFLNNLFSTHPPIEERIRILRKMGR